MLCLASSVNRRFQNVYILLHIYSQSLAFISFLFKLFTLPTVPGCEKTILRKQLPGFFLFKFVFTSAPTVIVLHF